MKYKIGDWLKDTGSEMTWEVTQVRDNNADRYTAICVISNDSWKVGDYGKWQFTDGSWVYLGNFAKVDNFTTLYDLMNE